MSPHEPLQDYVYFDVLDTDRTAFGPERDANRAEECTLTGASELKLAVLRGQIPVFPQTYGWDSASLLAFSTMNDKDPLEGAAFRTLIRQGYIRIRLRKGFDSLWDAALLAFRPGSGYQEFGSWPELNLEGGYVDRRAVIEGMETRRYSSDVPEDVRRRLETLERLSKDARQAPPAEYELKRENKLVNLIRRASECSRAINSPITQVLTECTQVSDPNKRTDIDAFLKKKANQLTGEGKDDQIVREARDVTNACFNVIAAECVGARAALTFSLLNSKAVDIMRHTLPRCTITDVLQSAETDLGSDEISELAVVSWERVEDLLSKFGRLEPIEKERQAAAAQLITEIVTTNARRYVVRSEIKNFLAESFLWGTASYVGSHLDAALGTPGTFSGIAGSIAGGLGALNLRQDEKERAAVALQKKWLGLLQRQRAHSA
jgi:hypothetical protein